MINLSVNSSKRWIEYLRAAVLCSFLLPGVVSGATARAGQQSSALPGDRAYPESITSTRDGTLYVSSFAGGGVTRIRPGALEGEIWIKPGAFETRSTFGVLADEKAGILWVCSNDLSALGIPGPSDVKGAALKGFDLETGEGRVSASFPAGPAICNDIAVGPDGAAYVTNSLGPQILRLKPGSQKLEIWKTDPLFQVEAREAGLDGLDFGKDGNLYVNTFSKSKLFRVVVENGEAGEVTPLVPTRPLVLSDGLRSMEDGSFLMAEGGGRLDRVWFEGESARIEVLRDGVAGGVTGVTTVGDTAWISVGQLGVLTNPARKGEKPGLPFRVEAVPLAKP